MAARNSSNSDGAVEEPKAAKIDLSKLDTSIFYFGRGPGHGWAADIIKDMEVDQPVAVIYPETTDTKGATSTMHAAAKRAGIKIACRVVDIDGQPTLAAMRLREEGVDTE
jgi:hypothetical protein